MPTQQTSKPKTPARATPAHSNGEGYAGVVELLVPTSPINNFGVIAFSIAVRASPLKVFR